jgi:hypothetical protein
VVADAKEILAVNKQISHKFHTKWPNLEMINKVDFKDKYLVEVSNSFASSEDPNPSHKVKSIHNGIIEGHPCWFRRNRATTGQIFFIHQKQKKKWEYNETAHQLFVDFKKAYDSVRREILYNTLIEFGVPMKLVRLITMCLNETCSKVRICEHLSNSVPFENGLKQGGALSPLLFNFGLECAIRKVGDTQVGLKLNGTHHFLAYADDVNAGR